MCRWGDTHLPAPFLAPLPFPCAAPVSSLSGFSAPFCGFLGAGPVVACDVVHLQPVDAINQGGDWCCLVPLWVMWSEECVFAILDVFDVHVVAVGGGEC